jgi:hypothetical protein
VNLLSLAPPAQTVLVGDPVSLDLRLDFDDPSVGGGVDFFYPGALLVFIDFTFNSGLGDDPGFRRLPDGLPGELRGLGFGNFDGLSGSLLVGTLTFNTLDVGLATLGLAVNAGGLGQPGPFVSALTFDVQDVVLAGAVVEILAPEPGSFSLVLLLGLGLIAWRWRQQQRACR